LDDYFCANTAKSVRVLFVLILSKECRSRTLVEVCLAIDFARLGASPPIVYIPFHIHLCIESIHGFNCVPLLPGTLDLLWDMKLADQRVLGDDLLLPVSLDFA
jgi:hypothetical protein